MFKDVGKEIKSLAEKYIISAMIPFVIIAIAVLALLAEEGYSLVGLVVAAIIVLWKYSNARRDVILLYGYGELIDKVKSMEESLTKKTISDKPSKVTAKKVDIPKAERKPDGSWVCAFCDHENSANEKFCKSCGVEAQFN